MMKKRNLIIWTMVVSLSVYVIPAFGWVEFNDGSSHDITTTIGSARVDYDAPGIQTTVNLLSGGIVESELIGYNDSYINIFGGTITGHLESFDNTQVNVSGGFMDHLIAKGTSQVNISGGTIKLDLQTRDHGEVYVYGGDMARDLIVGGGLVTIYGSGFALNGVSIAYPATFTSRSGNFNFESGRSLTGFLASGEPFDTVFKIGPGRIVLAPIPEPAAAPVADADGPYTIYVGDALTLDANDSTDADNDIITYMWDLDDVEGFETDAGGQAVFEVSYAYLQSLGLIVDHIYNIHVQVTDSEGQSDVADTTLIIVPKPAVQVAVDIKPGSCPNPVNVKSSGVLPIAILGSAALDVTTIDAGSIFLNGMRNVRSGYEDVAGFIADANDCECTTLSPDGYLDLTLKFKTQDIVATLGEVNHDDVLELQLDGVLYDETPIEGADCILIRGRHKPINPADINKDGVVNTPDFAIFTQNWLQSSIVDE